jgi:hypothetical protein
LLLKSVPSEPSSTNDDDDEELALKCSPITYEQQFERIFNDDGDEFITIGPVVVTSECNAEEIQVQKEYLSENLSEYLRNHCYQKYDVSINGLQFETYYKNLLGAQYTQIKLRDSPPWTLESEEHIDAVVDSNILSWEKTTVETVICSQEEVGILPFNDKGSG